MINTIEERRALVKKLEQADEEYESLIQKANEEGKVILQEAKTKKNQIIAEAWSIADSQQKDILEKAHRQAEQVVKNAELKAANLEVELENNFEKGVKATTERVVKKLLKEDKTLQKDYLDALIKEANS